MPCIPSDASGASVLLQCGVANDADSHDTLSLMTHGVIVIVVHSYAGLSCAPSPPCAPPLPAQASDGGAAGPDAAEAWRYARILVTATVVS